jgi:hypothetical protein
METLSSYRVLYPGFNCIDAIGLEPAERGGFSFRVIEAEPGAKTLPLATTGGEWRATETREEVSLWLRGLELCLHLHLASKEGTIELPRRQSLSPVQWRNVLRVLYFYAFLEKGGLLLHASGLVRHGRAYLFPGVSDAGKTTIVRQSPGMPVLSDEVVAVELHRNGGNVTAYGTPFYGDWGRPGEPVAAPVEGLYFPVKAQENRVVSLTPRETLTRLLRCILTYTTYPPRLQHVFGLGVQLAFQVPGYAFYFKPGPDIWETLGVKEGS